MLSYTPLHGETAFLLGGIGTGSVSLGARGELRDWELLNRPGKGVSLPCTFFCIRTAAAGQTPQVRILEARIRPPYGGPNGWRMGRNEFPGEMGGIPRFADAHMTIAWPFARVELLDASAPVRVLLEAFSPFIPLNSADSAIPCAVFNYSVTNTSQEPLQVSLAATLLNFVGFDGLEPRAGQFAGNRARVRCENGLSGIFFDKPGQPENGLLSGSLALLTDQDATFKPEWIKGEWWDGVQEFWDDFTADGQLEPAVSGGVGSALSAPELTIGSMALSQDLEPGETRNCRFVLAWHFPNRLRGWWPAGEGQGTIRNDYAARFSSAWEAGRYLLADYDRLYRASDTVRRAFACQTMPAELMAAAVRNLTVLRSQTCFQIEGGIFMGWEGCLDRMGSCHGTCTHVYNYAQSAACLFPDLERSARGVEFLQETDEDGAMAFRCQTPFGWPRSSAEPAIDGQFGTIVRLCREWKHNGDGQWLARLWPKARAALDFGLRHWDRDGDGLAETRQHNTYDIEFYGANPLGTSMMLAALAAGIAMARYLGDTAFADRWEARLALGRKKMQTVLYNGSWYRQLPADRPDYRYQPGDGCLSDQLVGQFMADCAGLGDLLDSDQIRSALLAIVRHNFCESFLDRPALHRTYVLNDEQGLLLCTWPDGDRPAMPMPYADEVWSGVTYSVAAMLLRRGLTDEAVKLVAAVNRCHDGVCRNPFNEAECGHHYARSMASWALITAWSGMQPDLPAGRINFDPVFADDGLAFFSCARAWGLLGCLNGSRTAHVLGGCLDGVKVTVRHRPVDVVNGWPDGATMRDMQESCTDIPSNNRK